VPRPSTRGEAKPQRLSQSTIARTYATVCHFARWIHQHAAAFPLGCPTDGVKAPEEEEPKWKGLSRLEQIRLLYAAQTLRVRKGRGTDQGLRDHVLITTLLGAGLRVSELLAIDVDQYDQRGFVHVLRKGGHVQRFIPIQKQHWDVLDAWLEQRGDVPGPLFPTRSGKRLDRTQAFLILKRVAQQAIAHLLPDQHLDVSPHVLRHTLLRKVANEKGVHYGEKRSDLLLSTLRKTVEAMGGKLSLVAEFPDRPPIVLSGIAEDDPAPKPGQREGKARHNILAHRQFRPWATTANTLHQTVRGGDQSLTRHQSDTSVPCG
jgi:integrase